MEKKYNIFSFGKASKGWTAVAVIANLILIATTVVLFDRIGFIVDKVYNGEITSLGDKLFLSAVLAMVAALVVKFFFSWVANKAVYTISSKVKVGARELMYSKIIELELSYRDVKKTGSLTSTAVEGVEQLENIFGLCIPQAFLSVIAPVGLYFYVKKINPSIALTLLLLVVFIPISLIFVRAWINRVSKKHWFSYENLHAYYLDSLQGITTLKTFGLVGKRKEEIGTKSENFRIRTMKLLYSNITSTLSMDIISMCGTAVGITLAIKYMQSGLLSIGSAAVIVLIAYEFFRPLRILGAYTHVAMQGISSSKSILELLNKEPDRHVLARRKGKKKIKGDNLDIRFEDVTFSYAEDRNPVLKNATFEIETGKITALVGESGSGKSTVANLIVRFYEPNSGRITVGGVPLSEIDPVDIRNKIAMVSQRTYLFHGSIRENLLIAKPDATDEELLEACKGAGIYDFVVSLPEKLDASLVEQAKNLSSGQIQRISIARALLKNAPILILDEPTSNVDSENEEKIQATLQEIAKTKTTLVIAHRLRTVRDAHKIMTLKDGKIVETGTHKELIEKNGVYANLVRTQNKYEQPAITS
ncbi:MAG: ABC transporter ATP-binding protein/permease [Candidatus Schekmanbacteria bacterium]|nr:MAG: ABC transporter ATP-binding protein/permease [Candidatus Schekmanbacteria bacterium]